MEAIRGFNYSEVNGMSSFLKACKTIGIQATNLSLADEILHEMVENDNVSFIFSFTSTVISSGLREVVSQFIRDAKPKAIITTAGAIEEDIMKTLGDFYLGSFNTNDVELRKKGINRIGNIFVPNERYEQLENFVRPIFESFGDSTISPSELVDALSVRISDEYSFLFAARQNGVQVFCPAITDGALGIHLFMHKQKHPKFALDVTKDMKLLANIVFDAKETGALILGGGMIKHHTIGINLLRGGLDYAVYVTSAVEQDASVSGAFPKEGVSWGKIKSNSMRASVWGDYSIIFPLLALSLHDKLNVKNSKK